MPSPYLLPINVPGPCICTVSPSPPSTSSCCYSAAPSCASRSGTPWRPCSSRPAPSRRTRPSRRGRDALRRPLPAATTRARPPLLLRWLLRATRSPGPQTPAAMLAPRRGRRRAERREDRCSVAKYAIRCFCTAHFTCMPYYLFTMTCI